MGPSYFFGGMNEKTLKNKHDMATEHVISRVYKRLYFSRKCDHVNASPLDHVRCLCSFTKHSTPHATQSDAHAQTQKHMCCRAETEYPASCSPLDHTVFALSVRIKLEYFLLLRKKNMIWHSTQVLGPRGSAAACSRPAQKTPLLWRPLFFAQFTQRNYPYTVVSSVV